MKTKLILTAVAAMLSVCSFAQTKGTNTLGLGVTSYQSELSSSGTTEKQKENLFSLGYGHFIKDNIKIGFMASYGSTKTETSVTSGSTSESNAYGGEVNFQKYFPLFKTFYAYAGGRIGYLYEKQNVTGFSAQTAKIDNYTAGAYGGLTWFLSKRFALEANLLSANIVVNSMKATAGNGTNNVTLKSTSLNLKTEGAINNLGFKIYFLF
jgi:hypothetical protein